MAMVFMEGRPPSISLLVAVDLPLGALLVGLLPLPLLDPDEVVDVVLVAHGAERLTQHVALLKLTGRVEQVAREELDPLGLTLGGIKGVEGGRVGLAGIQAALGTVPAGR